MRPEIAAVGVCFAMVSCGVASESASTTDDTPQPVTTTAVTPPTTIVPIPTSAPAVPDGQSCRPGPSPSAGVDDTVEGIRGEALVEHLTGIDEIMLQSEQEGVEIVYDHPNFGGVYGDRAGGWVVAVLDCDAVDADRIAQLAGGPGALRLIQVEYTFEEINEFSRRLRDELVDADINGSVLIDSTLTGRHIIVQLEHPDALGGDFAASVPSDAFTVRLGEPENEE